MKVEEKEEKEEKKHPVAKKNIDKVIHLLVALLTTWERAVNKKVR